MFYDYTEQMDLFCISLSWCSWIQTSQRLNMADKAFPGE